MAGEEPNGACLAGGCPGVPEVGGDEEAPGAEAGVASGMLLATVPAALAIANGIHGRASMCGPHSAGKKGGMPCWIRVASIDRAYKRC